MLHRSVLRVGAALAMLGAVLGIVFNVLHPRGDEFTVAEELRLASEEGIWLFDHYILGWVIGIGLLTFIVIGRSFSSEPSASWGRVASLFGVGAAAIGFVTITVDGFAMNQAAEAGGASAEAVGYVGQALFLATIGALFGVTPIVFGVAILSGDDYPAWLGWLAVLAGLLGIVAATIIFFDGFSTGTINGLFVPASLLFSLWGGLAGYWLWQRTSVPAAAPTTRPAA